jgi:hypothetical protein
MYNQRLKNNPAMAKAGRSAFRLALGRGVYGGDSVGCKSIY